MFNFFNPYTVWLGIAHIPLFLISLYCAILSYHLVTDQFPCTVLHCFSCGDYADINKRGYDKFLSISSGVSVRIDEDKIEEDKVWDGLKGYRTNTDLPADQVYDNYQQLWNVERAFRITKGTLEVRPMFHFSEKRIEAHVCICFVALKVYKELERLLKISGCPYSVDNVLRIAEVIVTIEVDLPENGKTLTKTIYTSKEERDIAYLIETDDWLNKNG